MTENAKHWKERAEYWQRCYHNAKKLADDRDRTVAESRQEMDKLKGVTTRSTVLMMAAMLRLRGGQEFTLVITPEEMIAAAQYDADIIRLDEGAYQVNVSHIPEEAACHSME